MNQLVKWAPPPFLYNSNMFWDQLRITVKEFDFVSHIRLNSSFTNLNLLYLDVFGHLEILPLIIIRPVVVCWASYSPHFGISPLLGFVQQWVPARSTNKRNSGVTFPTRNPPLLGLLELPLP